MNCDWNNAHSVFNKQRSFTGRRKFKFSYQPKTFSPLNIYAPVSIYMWLVLRSPGKTHEIANRTGVAVRILDESWLKEMETKGCVTTLLPFFTSNLICHPLQDVGKHPVKKPLVYLGLVNTLFFYSAIFWSVWSNAVCLCCIHVVAFLTGIAAWPVLPACACQEPGMIASVCSWGQLHCPLSCV